jgi:hypothetical protein
MAIAPAIAKAMAINFIDLTVINLPLLGLNEVALNLNGCEGCFERLQSERGPLGRALERIAIACTGKWRDLRYGTGSVSDLSIGQKAY